MKKSLILVWLILCMLLFSSCGGGRYFDYDSNAPTASDYEDRYNDRYDEGYDDGYKKGYDEGYEEGYEDARREYDDY
ncbi:MAG: hypothetical protein IKP64_12780 [Selenomonadaceae bacterium]|nr:hypothetical protein [Selenomonadaceae bacterium]